MANYGDDVTLRLNDIAMAVNLSTEQIAKLCGVSRRQLSYWIQRGIIGSEQSGALATIEKVLLVKKELDAGRNLRQAVRRVEHQIAERENLIVDLSITPQSDITEALATRLEAIERLLLRQRELVEHGNQVTIERLIAELDRLQLERLLERAADEERRELVTYLGQAAYLIHRLTSELTG